MTLPRTAATADGGAAVTREYVEETTDGGTTWSTIVSNSGNTAATYSDTGLTHTTTYTYRVSAINSAGTGSSSSVASATTLAVAPSSPARLAATATSPSQISLNSIAPTE